MVQDAGIIDSSLKTLNWQSAAMQDLHQRDIASLHFPADGFGHKIIGLQEEHGGIVGSDGTAGIFARLGGIHLVAFFGTKKRKFFLIY
jgi:hypothetical protein